MDDFTNTLDDFMNTLDTILEKLDLKNLDLKFWTPFWTPNAKHGRMMQYMDHNLDVICKTWTNHWTIVVKHGLLSWTSIVYYGRLLQIMDFTAKNVDAIKFGRHKICKIYCNDCKLRRQSRSWINDHLVGSRGEARSFCYLAHHESR